MKRVCRLGIGLATLLCALTTLMPVPSQAQLALDLSTLAPGSCGTSLTQGGFTFTVESITNGCRVIIGSTSGVPYTNIKILNNFGTARVEFTEPVGGTNHKIQVIATKIRNAGGFGTPDVMGTLIEVKRSGTTTRSTLDTQNQHVGHHYYSGTWNTNGTQPRTTTSQAFGFLCDDADNESPIDVTDNCPFPGPGHDFTPDLVKSLSSTAPWSLKNVNEDGGALDPDNMVDVFTDPTWNDANAFLRGTIEATGLRARTLLPTDPTCVNTPTNIQCTGDELKVSLTIEADNSGIPRDDPLGPTCDKDHLRTEDAAGNFCFETRDGFVFKPVEQAVDQLQDEWCPDRLANACAANRR